MASTPPDTVLRSNVPLSWGASHIFDSRSWSTSYISVPYIPNLCRSFPAASYLLFRVEYERGLGTITTQFGVPTSRGDAQARFTTLNRDSGRALLTTAIARRCHLDSR